jgi:hypothetical protein
MVRFTSIGNHTLYLLPPALTLYGCAFFYFIVNNALEPRVATPEPLGRTIKDPQRMLAHPLQRIQLLVLPCRAITIHTISCT